jgi:hypothetical protein
MVIHRVLDRNNIVCQRRNDAWIGKKHTLETKQKMSQARKEYWEAKKNNSIDNI